MKLKSARRFLARNQWKLTVNRLDNWPNKKLARKERYAKRILGDIRFKKF